MENNQISDNNYRAMANAIRFLSMDAVQSAKSGHPGMPMGMADVATVLFKKFLKVYCEDPNWPDRDRFILSAGHGSMLIYSINYLLGYKDMSLDQIKNFRQLGSITAGHPEYGHALGIETTTGPLGQGLANAVGMALSERILNDRFGDELINHLSYVIVGDGCLMEGISHEAIDLAGHLKLRNLIVFWDDNEISIDGKTNLATSTDQLSRFKSSGWHVQSIDGHDFLSIENAILEAKSSPLPSLIGCKTIIGYGSPNMSGTSKVHGAPLGEDEIKNIRKKLKWESEPFFIPSNILQDWRKISKDNKPSYDDWHKRLKNSKYKNEFLKTINGEIPNDVFENLSNQKIELKNSRPNKATRQSSQMTLEVINKSTNLTIGGSADLTGSNLTLTDGMNVISPGQYFGSYVHYGVREHAMGAIMNGIALHGGLIPYGGTFLVFSDYLRGSLRLSALMGLKVIYVLSHDSIGLGEDGPTHQPVEHLAMLRATPNLLVFRPADCIEVNECWEIALKNKLPSVIALSRQGLPTLRIEKDNQNFSSFGAYLIFGQKFKRDITFMASGSEVHIAIEVAKTLFEEFKISASVISIPCWELFDKQTKEYKNDILGSSPKIAIEASSSFGWHKWLNDNDKFIGMKGFGSSAPGKDLFDYFNINYESLLKEAKKTCNLK